MTAKEMKSWRERVDRANAVGLFTSEDKHLASEWASCAVGEQHHKAPTVVIIPKSGYGDWLSAPIDGKLYELGSFFDVAVRADDVMYAYELLDRIAARVMELEDAK